MPLGRKIRYGMVGGGPYAFIGAVHRKAAALDGEIDLVPVRSHITRKISPARC